MLGFSSFIKNFEHHAYTGFSDFSEYTIATAVTVSYLALYTAYDKQKKSLVWKNLSDLIGVKRGWDWTLVECNKALSLAGMTTLLMSFLPTYQKRSRGLLMVSMVMLWTHSSYSMYKFYDYKISKVLSDKAIKRLSVGFGIGGQVSAHLINQAILSCICRVFSFSYIFDSTEGFHFVSNALI